MMLRVLAFASAAEAIGAAEIEVELADGSGMAELESRLTTDYPGLRSLWPRLALAIDGELAGTEAGLRDGSEVALLPPVSGGQGDDRAALTDEPIDIARLVGEILDPRCGAVLLFVGTVRGHHQQRTVDQLTYEAYRPMAKRVLERIVTDLETAAPGLRVAIVHRLGEIPAGEASVAIATASPHRAAAYEASRTALERLKQEVPIWKQQHYGDGEAEWREEETLRHPGGEREETSPSGPR
jgi:molybdopterin synthase catalytic subunit/molybdopterin converting factor small subunit